MNILKYFIKRITHQIFLNMKSNINLSQILLLVKLNLLLSTIFYNYILALEYLKFEDN